MLGSDEKSNAIYDISNKMSDAVEYVIQGAIAALARGEIPIDEDVIYEMIAGTLTALHNHATKAQIQRVLDQIEEEGTCGTVSTTSMT